MNTKSNEYSDQDIHPERKRQSRTNDMCKLNSSVSATDPASSAAVWDPIYRIMHAQPRSDILEIVRCRFGAAECERAARYFDDSFMRHPLRHLRLQIGCDMTTGMHYFLPKLQHHHAVLRLLDLSRNNLNTDDVATLAQLLELKMGGGSLEVLDLSYNRRVGNDGAVSLLRELRDNNRIRALILRGVSIDDEGALEIASLLRRRRIPAQPEVDKEMHFQEASSQRAPSFFLNLNENCIGAVGTISLGKGIPAHISLTLCRQQPVRSLSA